MATKATIQKAIIEFVESQGGQYFAQRSTLETDLSNNAPKLRQLKCTRDDVAAAIDACPRLRRKTRSSGAQGIVLMQSSVRDVRQAASRDRYASQFGPIGSHLTNRQCTEVVLTTAASATIIESKEEEMSNFAQTMADLIEQEVATRVEAIKVERDVLSERLGESRAEVAELVKKLAIAVREADELRGDAEKFRSAKALFAA